MPPVLQTIARFRTTAALYYRLYSGTYSTAAVPPFPLRTLQRTAVAFHTGAIFIGLLGHLI